MKVHPARLAGIDNLRLLVILLVVLMNSTMAFALIDPEYTPITLLARALEPPLMPILFFIAGYFAIFSLRVAGPGRFFRVRIRLVGIPWVVGSVAVAPFVTWLEYRIRDVTGPVGPLWSHQSVYWFFGVLVLFFSILAALYTVPAVRRRLDQEPNEDCELCRNRRTPGIVLFYCAITAAFYLIHRFVPLDTWIHWRYLPAFQPNRVPLYAGYFVFGLVAGRGRFLHREWLRDEKAWPRLRFWFPLALVTTAGYLLNRMSIPPAVRGDTVVQIATALLFNGMVLGWLMVSIAGARCYLERLGPRWTRLARSAYGIYIVHPIVLFPLVLLIQRWSWLPRLPAFPVVVAATVVVSALLADGWQRLRGNGTGGPKLPGRTRA